MKFEKILPMLRAGEVVRRSVFQRNLVIFMQIPASIDFPGIVTMRSIPDAMKVLMLLNCAGVRYHDQFIMYDFSDQSCTYYPFDGEDMNADDWEVVDVLHYKPYDN